MRRLAAVCWLALCGAAIGQVATPPTITVDEAVASQQIVRRAAPVYPPIALAAHVDGMVTLVVSVNETGHVTDVAVTSGPPMLMGAAVNCVRRWVYKPFEVEGHAVRAKTTVTLPFKLNAPGHGQADKNSEAYERMQIDCNQALQGSNRAKAAERCKAAADKADSFPADDYFLERASGYRWAAVAYVRNGQTAEC